MLNTSANPPLGDKDPQTEGLYSIVEALVHFETLRHRPVLLYMAEDRSPYSKSINDDDILVIYDMLRRLGPLEQLDLIVNTSGGERDYGTQTLTPVAHDGLPSDRSCSL